MAELVQWPGTSQPWPLANLARGKMQETNARGNILDMVPSVLKMNTPCSRPIYAVQQLHLRA